MKRRYLKSNELQNFVRRHVGDDGAGALRHILTSEQMTALYNVGMDLRRANLSISGNVAPGGSPTTANQSALQAGHETPTLAGALAAVEVAGEAGAHVMGPFGRIAGVVELSALKAMRSLGFKTVDDLVAQAVLDPGAMKALLAKLPSKADSASRLIALKTQMRALALNAALQPGGGDQKRQSVAVQL